MNYTNKYQARNFNPAKMKETKKSCAFCTNNKLMIDYKDQGLLNQYISGQAKIKKTKRTGVCRKHQRQLAKAIKNARIMNLLPAASVHNFYNINEKRTERQERIKTFEEKKVELKS
jgi:small subunit ribosomal protein S18